MSNKRSRSGSSSSDDLLVDLDVSAADGSDQQQNGATLIGPLHVNDSIPSSPARAAAQWVSTTATTDKLEMDSLRNKSALKAPVLITAQRQHSSHGDDSESESSVIRDNDTSNKPLAENKKRIASRYDYDMTWDMVGRQQQQQRGPDAAGRAQTDTTTTTHSAPSTPRGKEQEEEQILLPPRSAGPYSQRLPHRRHHFYHRYQQHSLRTQNDDADGWDDFFETTDALSESAASNESSTSSGSRRRRPLRGGPTPLPRGRHHATSGIPETIEESTSGLDAGMARLRRWIKSRSRMSRAAQQQQQQQQQQYTGSTTTMDDSLASFNEYYRSSSEHWSTSSPERINRQRALSEPEGIQMRNFLFERATSGPHSIHGPATSIETQSTVSVNGPSMRQQQQQRSDGSSEPSNENDDDDDNDPNRQARMRWIRINRRFQLTITIVALIFSLLLFSILVCWVVLTSAYVVSIDKSCDVPLKTYFWLATLQLVLDVFRTDIIRFICQWESHSNERIPIRVIIYNILYLVYALLVLRLGIRSVFLDDDSTCDKTAPELHQASAVYVSLSIAAWSTIVMGYLVPFCFVATLLTWNGYSPAAEAATASATTGFGVFPAAFSREGAPPGCIDELRTVSLDSFPDDYPKECCICMCDFVRNETIVATECEHVFHRRCCQEWLRQARTCPVCRTDIPSTLAGDPEAAPSPQPVGGTIGTFPRRQEFQQEVQYLFRLLRQQEARFRRERSGSIERQQQQGSGTIARISTDTDAVSSTIEEGRNSSNSNHSSNRY